MSPGVQSSAPPFRKGIDESLARGFFASRTRRMELHDSPKGATDCCCYGDADLPPQNRSELTKYRRNHRKFPWFRRLQHLLGLKEPKKRCLIVGPPGSMTHFLAGSPRAVLAGTWGREAHFFRSEGSSLPKHNSVPARLFLSVFQS